MRGTLWGKKVKISQKLYYLQTNTIATRRNFASDFRLRCCYVNVYAKTTMWTKCQRKWHHEGYLPKWRPYYFVEYQAMSKTFAVSHHRYNIHHTHQHTYNIISSCSILSLKTPLHFILQLISVPYRESGLCKLGMELDSCNFTYIAKNQTFLWK